MIPAYRIAKLEDDCICVFTRQSELIAFCTIDVIDNKHIIRRLNAKGNGDGMIFLLEHIKNDSGMDVIYIYYSTVLEISRNCYEKLKSINWILMIE